MYFPDIPAATDDPSVSQSAIQTNFGTLNIAFGLNHVALGTGSQGKHTMVEMPVKASSPTTISGEGTLYTKSVTNGAETRSQMAYVSDGDKSGGPPTVPEVYQMTRVIHGSFPLFATNTIYKTVGGIDFTGGWTFLPGNILLQYGTATTPTGTTVPFPVTFTSAVFGVQVSIFQNTPNRHIAYARGAALDSFVTSNLSGDGPSETSTIAWMAIGI